MQEKMMIKIIILRDPSKKQHAQLSELMLELYPKNKAVPYDELKYIVEMGFVKVFCAIDTEDENHIIGTSSLVFYEKLGGKVCVIEDVVVSDKYRGKGTGTMLTDAMIAEAKKLKADFIDVATRRDDAVKFYEKLGFSRKDSERPFHALRKYIK
jgi:ribosomal protein S18 acetylase RimI-like enzyme